MHVVCQHEIASAGQLLEILNWMPLPTKCILAHFPCTLSDPLHSVKALQDFLLCLQSDEVALQVKQEDAEEQSLGVVIAPASGALNSSLNISSGFVQVKFLCCAMSCKRCAGLWQALTKVACFVLQECWESVAALALDASRSQSVGTTPVQKISDFASSQVMAAALQSMCERLLLAPSRAVFA